MTHYQTLLFDLDNTLIDFSASEEKALNHIYQNYFQKTGSKDHFCNHYHHINRKLWQQVEAGTITPQAAAKLRFEKLIKKLSSKQDDHPQILSSYQKALAEHTHWFPGVLPMLDQLAKHYQLGIITNGITMVQQLKYQRLNMGQWFSCYLISEQIGIAKPNPVIFDKALEELQANRATTLMIGDSLSSDYQGALNSGLDFCWINKEQNTLAQNLPKPRFNMQSITEFKIPQTIT